MKIADNSKNIIQILNDYLFWQNKEKSNKTLKTIFVSIPLLLILCQMRVTILIVLAIWVRATKNSPFAMIIIEYLYDEAK